MWLLSELISGIWNQTIKTKLTKYRYLVLASVVVFLFSYIYWSDQIVTAKSVSVIGSKGLTLSPLRSELEIAPGTSLDGELSVTNSSRDSITVNLNAEVFSVTNQQYDYAFTSESDVVKWVTFKHSKIVLTAGQSEKVKFTVGVPLSAEPGGRYIGLFAGTNTSTRADGLNSRQRVASLLYITILGNVSREGHLVSISSPWLVGDKAIYSFALQNTGTTHYRSRYDVQVKNILGNNVVANGQGEALILPGTVRSVSDSLPLPKLPGIYKIIYTVGLGDSPAKAETRYILYLPPLAVVVLVAIGVVVVFEILRKKYFSKN